MQTEVLVALVGVGSVIIGASIPLFGQWRDSKEKYQQMAFEKRLQVHQQAYGLCYMVKKVDPETKEINYIEEGFDYRLSYNKSFGIPDNMPIIKAQRDAEHFEHLWDRLLREHEDD